MADREDEVRAEQRSIHDAVQEALTTGERALRGGLLTGWVLVSEWVAGDGERWLHTVVSEGSEPWQVAGYLRSATVDCDDALRFAGVEIEDDDEA